jgi:hypothetical protein
MKIKLSFITIDAGTQARDKINQDVVNDYAQLLGEGTIFPPVVVFGEKNILADGWHRYFAHRAAGFKEIEIDSREGDVRDAIFYGFGANKQRGLQMNQVLTPRVDHRSDADGQGVVQARRSGRSLITSACPPTTVLRLRQAMEGAGKIIKQGHHKDL